MGDDPRSVQTLSELAAALDGLRGGRSYGDLDRAARKHGRRLAGSTLNNLLHAKAVPTWDTVVTFLFACGLDDEAQVPWSAAWERAATGRLRRPEGAVRVRDCRARLLGVHASIRAAGAGGELPPYVIRDFDPVLRAAIAAAGRDGGLVLLLGGSSVGKTRALYEAVREVLPEWWLVHPADAAAVARLAAQPAPRTVVWLDELQRYLDGTLPAGVVRGLVAAGAVLVATLWPHEYTARTVLRQPGRPDPYAQDRDVLGLAEIVTVPDRLSAAERRRGEALAGDARIRIALDTRDAGFTQVLAAGPELIHWWDNAPADQCCGRAVITAALDARRVGARASLSRELLAAAAPGYLTPAQQAIAPADWLERALDYATTPLRGAAATLSPVPAGMGRVGGYTVADYLHQHARILRRTTPLPDVAWQALVDHCDVDDAGSLGYAAERRMRYEEAEALYRRSTETASLARLLVSQERVEDLRELADAAPGEFGRELAELLGREGRAEEAMHHLRRAADAGDFNARNHLCQLLADAGAIDELRRRTLAGDEFAWLPLLLLLKEQGRGDEAIPDLRSLAAGGDPNALWLLCDLLDEHGRVEELRELAGAGQALAVRRLASLLERHGRVDEALTVLRPLADDGDEQAQETLAFVLGEHGRLDELSRRADGHAAIKWYEMLAERGRVDDIRRAAHGGDPLAVVELIRVLADTKEVDELRQWADGGDTLAALHLAALLAAQGRTGELRARADSGDTKAVLMLSGLLADEGRIDDAIAVLRPLAEQRQDRPVDPFDEQEAVADEWQEPDDSHDAVRRLIDLHVRRGDLDRAIALLRRDVELGYWYSEQKLVDLLADHGRVDELRAEVHAGTAGAAGAARHLSTRPAA